MHAELVYYQSATPDSEACRMNRQPVKIQFVKQNYLATLACWALLTFPLHTFRQQTEHYTRGDDSDWWSSVAVFSEIDLSAPRTNTQHRELAASTMNIAGIKLGFGEIVEAQAKFGHAAVVFRGDAATGRAQACYLTADSGTYLVFEEEGEGFGTSFYVFQGGRNWNGSELCKTTSLNRQEIKTADGLRLGLNENEVEAILGKPSTVSLEELTYVFEARKATTAGELEKLRRQHPDLSDQDFRDSFGSYYVESLVVAKFDQSKLTYFAVTESESFP